MHIIRAYEWPLQIYNRSDDIIVGPSKWCAYLYRLQITAGGCKYLAVYDSDCRTLSKPVRLTALYTTET